MKKRFIVPVLGCIALFFALSQGVFHSRPLSSLIALQEGFLHKENITFSVKALTAEESEKYLNRDVLDLGYQPVQVTIENQSPDPYALSPESIGLPLVGGRQVAKKVIKNSIPRSIGFKIAGFFFFPFIIPSSIDSLMTIKSHNKLKKNLLSKEVKNEIIPPYSSLNRVFFVPIDEYQGTYQVTLQNQENLSDRVFQITIPEVEDLQTVNPLPVVEENYYLTHES